DMLYAEDTRALVSAIVVMAQALRLEVVAEGVENRQQLELLREMGCDHVQGFLLSRPVPATDIPPWLEQSIHGNEIRRRG
ncbi:MAG: EAL domain-containing protein, partial [Thioalkalivibrio sp.]